MTNLSEPLSQRLSHISSLPTELLQEIIGWTIDVPGKPSLRALCLVSIRFRDVAQPLLHASIILGGFEASRHRQINQLKTLSHASWYLGCYTRTITIDYTSFFTNRIDDAEPSRESSPIELALEEHLENVLLSLQNLEKVIWNVSNREPLWLQESIADSLLQLPKLDNVSFVAHYGAIRSEILAKFKDLRKLSVDKLDYVPGFMGYGDASIRFLYDIGGLLFRSPILSELEIHNLKGPELVFLFQHPSDRSLASSIPLRVKHIGITSRNLSIENFGPFSRQFTRLESISVLCCKSPHHFCRISTLANNPRRKGLWKVLLDDEVRLKKIVSGSCDKELVDYLKSYHGLEYFDINLRTSSITTPANVYERLMKALCKYHGETLVEFHVRTVYSEVHSAWTFAVGALLSMPNLRRFGIVYSGERSIMSANKVDTAPTIAFLITCCEMYLKNLEELIIYRPSYASQGSISTGEIDAIHRSILTYDIGEDNKSRFHVFCDQTAYTREVNVGTRRLAFVERKLI